LAILARMGVVPPALRSSLRRQLQDPRDSTPVPVRLEALRALAASRPIQGAEPWGRLAGAAAIVELAVARGQEGALGGWLRAAHMTPPDAWRDPRDLPAGWGAWVRMVVAEAWLASPADPEVAAAHLQSLGEGAAGDPRVEQRLRRLADGPLRDALLRALEPEPGRFGPRARLALLAGMLPPARQPEALTALVGESAAEPPGGLLLLGALGAGPVREGATTALLERVRRALEAPPSDEPHAEPWARACERTWNELLTADLDREAEAFRQELSELLRERTYPATGPGSRRARERPHPLAGELSSRRWPRLATAEAVALSELESPLPP